MAPNERLRGALLSARRTPTELAAHVGVDPKTVERWLSQGRIPHRIHRLHTAQFLDHDDVYLWPSTRDDNPAASEAELLRLYPNRGSVPPQTWQDLLQGAIESVDLLAFASSFIHDALPDFADQLAAKARAGVRVRLLFGDPTSEAVRLRGIEEGIGPLLASRCELTWAYLKPILDTPGLEARQHGATLYNSIFRFDDHVLVNSHSLGAPASHSPVLHLHRIPGGRLFTHYLASLERTWAAATPRTGTEEQRAS